MQEHSYMIYERDFKPHPQPAGMDCVSQGNVEGIRLQRNNKNNNMQTIIKPDGIMIPTDAKKVHGITTQRTLVEGISLNEVINQFKADLDAAACIVCHNVEFDKKTVGAEMIRLGMRDEVGKKKNFCKRRGALGIEEAWNYMIFG